MRSALAAVLITLSVTPGYAMIPVGPHGVLNEVYWGGYYCYEREPPHKPRIRHGCMAFWENRLKLFSGRSPWLEPVR
jgi:hypothetical protein